MSTSHHPFRVSRRQGSPNGLGQMMTLGSHIASSNAHPGYLRKGEQVGSFDIGSHINDPSAHVWYYLRRAELAMTLAQYNQSIDVSQFSGDNPNVSASYPVIVTTNLLKQVIASTSGVQLKKSDDESAISSAYVIGSTAGKLGETSNTNDVPAWGLFATLWNLVETFSYTSASGMNPLFVNNLVAPYYHTHSLDQIGPNGAADANHDHDEVYAALEHNHDTEYYKRGETLSGAVAESTLQNYGLMYTAANGSGGADLNEFVVTGNYAFPVDHDTSPVNTPTDLVTEKTNNTEYVGNLMLGVNRHQSDTDLFNHPFLYKRQKELGQSEVPICGESVSQTLVATRGFDSGAFDTDVYVRSGFSLDTACYIRLITETLFSVSPETLFSDYATVEDLAELFNDSLSDKEDFVVGYFAPVKGAMIRTADQTPQTGTSYFKSSRSNSSGEHVFDWSSWLAGYTTQAISGSAADNMDVLDAFVAHTKPLPHLTYFAQTEEYTSLLTSSVPSATETYYLKSGSTYTSIASTDPYLLRGYFVTTDTTPVSGKTYYTRKMDGATYSKDLEGQYTYDTFSGDAFDADTTYYEYGLIKTSSGTDGNTLWGKKKLVSGTDTIDTSATYYTYDEDAHTFMLSTIPNSNFNDGDTFVTGTLNKAFYIDYPIYTKTSSRSQVSVVETVTPITDTTTKFIRGNTYNYREYTYSEVSVTYTEGEPSTTPIPTDQYYTKSGDAYVKCALPLEAFVEGTTYYTRSIDYTSTKCTCAVYTAVDGTPDFTSTTEYYKYSNGEYVKVTSSEAGVTTYYTCNVVHGSSDDKTFVTVGAFVNETAIGDDELAPYALVTEEVDHTFPDDNSDMTKTVSDRIWMKQFFYKTRDTSIVSGKTYYQKVTDTDSDFKVVSLATGVNPAASDCYEAFGTEDLYDIWCAINDLIVNGFKLGSGEVQFKYEFGSDGTLLAWGSWRKTIDTLDPFWIRLLTMTPEALAKVSMNADGDKVYFNGDELVFSKDISVSLGKAHTHSNKSILDNLTYSDDHLKYSGASVAFVSELHSHSNKSVLDDISATDVGNWNNVFANNHSHSNKSILDALTQAVIDNSHTHDNQSVLNGVTSEKVAAWDDAASKSHEHSNSDVLDGITSAKVSAWDAIAGKIVVCTQSEYDALESPDPSILYFIHG